MTRLLRGALGLLLFAGCAGSGSDEAGRAAELGVAGEARDPRDEVAPTRATREATAEAASAAATAVGATAPRSAPVATPRLPAPEAGAAASAGSREDPEGPAAPRAVARLALRADVEVAEGEDGAGALVPARRPLAFDVDAGLMPPGARDPILQVGALIFRHYTHPRPGVLRFVAADRARLPPGAEVAVQYGEDPATRVVLARSLEVPR